MQSNDNRYQRKARYNPNRETYVDENGNYVYRVWDEEIKDYRCEVITVGDGGITPELCAMLDEMDAEEDADWMQMTTTSTRSLKYFCFGLR